MIRHQASGTACYDVQSFSLSARPGGFVLTFLLRTPFDSAFHIGLIGSVTHKKPGLFSYKPDCFIRGTQMFSVKIFQAVPDAYCLLPVARYEQRIV